MANDEYAAADELLPSYSRLNQPTFEELQRARTGNGFQHLGNAIGGALGGGAYRDLRGQQVFNQAATGSARLQDILLQANQRRDAEIGRRAAAKAFSDAGDQEKANAALNATNSHEAAQAIATIDRLRAIGKTSANLQALGATSQLGDVVQGFVGSSGGTNTEGDVKAGYTAAIPFAGTAPVGVSQTQLGSAIVPNSTRMGPHGEMYSEVAPSTQATVGTPATAAYLKSEAALQAERYASAERQKQGMGRDKLALSTNPDTNEVTVVDLTQGTSRPVTTALGNDMAGPPATLKAPAKAGVGKASFSPTELIDVTGSVKDDKGKYLPDQNNIQRFYDTKAAMKQAGDPNWNNDPLVLAKMKATDAENLASAAETGPPTDLATPPKPWYQLSSGTVPQQFDAQGRAMSALGDAGAAAPPVQASPNAPTHVGDSPYPEGTKLTKDGKQYIVKNGQPVPL